jgi:hypothetical protein
VPRQGLSVLYGNLGFLDFVAATVSCLRVGLCSVINCYLMDLRSCIIVVHLRCGEQIGRLGEAGFNRFSENVLFLIDNTVGAVLLL